jgi:predicted ATPase/class 3 adenylate cyclase
MSRTTPDGAPPVSSLPTGTVTFVFTDLEGSTRRWEEDPEGMRMALARHDELLREVVDAHGGHVVKTTGDGVLAAFARAPQAVLAAVDAQRRLTAEPWPTDEPLRVRMGLHTGEVDLVDGDYHGPPLNRAARLMSVAQGGQVLLSHITHGLSQEALAEGIESVDLGEHQLRDLSRPERVFQLVGEGLSSQVGELRTLDAFPGNLPVQLTSFVGREQEVEEITAAFTERRLVTITGVGGVGKTRLSLQVAAHLLPRFLDGAWVCELAAATEADTMSAMVATTLGVKPRTGMAMDEAVLLSLRDKQLMVVLDNCEHLLSAAGSLVDGLMRRCEGVSVLATSREGLGVAGEQVWPLRSLAVPNESTDVDMVGRSGSVQLFTDRATAVRPDFTLDDSNAWSVVEICRRLDGIPLALELAAARVAAMSPSEIAQLLDERFRLLTGGRRTAVERHQTLRAAVDWSYSLLDPVERLVFDRLSVFAGGFDAASAAAVVAGDGVEEWDVRDALLALVAKSLVIAETTDDALTRYQMLETLRQYAREQLEASGGTDGWRRRHAEHFAGFAEVARPELLGANELRWRTRVGVELENLRAAVTWALDSTEPGDAEIAVGIIAELGFEATMRRTSGVARWAENALDRLTDTTPGRRAAVLGSAGFGATFRGDFETARALAEQALREEITPDFPAPNQAVIVSCMTLVSAGEASAAVERALWYAEHFDRIGLRAFDRCNVRTTAAIWALFSGDAEAAKQQAQLAIGLALEIANPSSIAMASFVTGWTLADEAPDAALSYLERSVDLTRAGASDVVLSPTLTRIARIHARRGERERSWVALQEAIVHAHGDGDESQVAASIDQGLIAFGPFGAPEAAATLAGSVLAGSLAEMALTTPFEVAERDHCLDRVRAELGDERYDTAFERGAAMSYSDVVTYALEQLAPNQSVGALRRALAHGYPNPTRDSGVFDPRR